MYNSELNEFLQRETSMEESRRYRTVVNEYNAVTKIINEVEMEESNKKLYFKQKLKSLGVVIIEGKDKKNDELFGEK